MAKAGRKIEKRLAARQAAYDELIRANSALASAYHRPGSQNRKK